MLHNLLFQDRSDAAERLTHELSDYREREDVVVLAVPRGGVPLGHRIAQYLNAPLDVVLSKKIGHPRNSEFAVGSVSLNTRTIDPRVLVPEEYLEEETSRLREALKEKERKYFGEQERIPVEGKCALLVDDGVATGSTMVAAIDLLREEGAKEVVVAIPVASPSALSWLKEKADDVICLTAPRDFHAIGQFYQSFGQTSDEEVKRLLRDQREAE